MQTLANKIFKLETPLLQKAFSIAAMGSCFLGANI